MHSTVLRLLLSVYYQLIIYCYDQIYLVQLSLQSSMIGITVLKTKLHQTSTQTNQRVKGFGRMVTSLGTQIDKFLFDYRSVGTHCNATFSCSTETQCSLLQDASKNENDYKLHDIDADSCDVEDDDITDPDWAILEQSTHCGDALVSRYDSCDDTLQNSNTQDPPTER